MFITLNKFEINTRIDKIKLEIFREKSFIFLKF